MQPRVRAQLPCLIWMPEYESFAPEKLQKDVPIGVKVGVCAHAGRREPQELLTLFLVVLGRVQGRLWLQLRSQRLGHRGKVRCSPARGAPRATGVRGCVRAAAFGRTKFIEERLGAEPLHLVWLMVPHPWVERRPRVRHEVVVFGRADHAFEHGSSQHSAHTSPCPSP